uniref:Uncharacterized protein n=1 Tax=Arion vulgaris TaxID=1028688 RepID=A0A0B6ZNY1_9EUPU
MANFLLLLMLSTLLILCLCEDNEYLMDESTGYTYDPKNALVTCSFLPLEFLNCSDPEDLKGNITKRNEQGYGCTKVQWPLFCYDVDLFSFTGLSWNG